MNWIPLRVIAKPVLILLVAATLMALVRGHNEPGGGFIGGLLAASGFLVYALAHGPRAGRRQLRVPPTAIIGTGVLTAVGSGIFGLLRGEGFLAGQWWFAVPGIGKISSILLFDCGVYLVVLGGSVQILLWLLDAEVQEGEPS